MRKPRLRNQVLAAVGALAVCAVLASTVSLVQITDMNSSLEELNRISLPASKLFTQMRADAEVFERELNRSLGSVHWNDPRWTPKAVPLWIIEVMDGEMENARKLLGNSHLGGRNWGAWIEELSHDYQTLKADAERLYFLLQKKDRDTAGEVYPKWTQFLESWSAKLRWGAAEHERALREGFSSAQNRMENLRTGLEIILLVIVCFSFLLLWLGERALRPLEELTRLAREITRRGLKREDKYQLPDIPLNRNDEVSDLAREFHRMATQLLEREKVVEQHHANELQLLKRLREAENLAVMGRLSAQVAHEVRNPLHSIGLEAEIALDLAQKAGGSSTLKQSLQSILSSVERLETITENYLKLSRLSKGDQKNIDLREILQSVLATYASLCEKHGVHMEWKTQGKGPWTVCVDVPLLEQAIGNLLQNSVQALDGVSYAKKITFSMGTGESGRLWLAIEDNGPGISPEIEQKLFTPFFTTKAQGTGLGLSFVKKVVEDQRGTVHFSKPQDGNTGTRFEIVLEAAVFEGKATDAGKNENLVSR